MGWSEYEPDGPFEKGITLKEVLIRAIIGCIAITIIAYSIF